MDEKLLTIVLGAQYAQFNYTITYYTEDDYNIIINTTDDSDYSSLISTRGDIDAYLDDLKEYYIEEGTYDEITEMENEICKASFMDLLNDVEYVRIVSDINEDDDVLYDFQRIRKYIDNNPTILNKKVEIEVDLSNETFAEFNRIFGDIKDKFYFNIHGNTQLVDYQGYSDTIKINDIVDEIKSLNLSPLEQTMYAYDIVRDRVYVAEDEQEDYSVSRDLSSVLTGDKIVCVGFANIFNTILNRLGIKSGCFVLYNEESKRGHMRVQAYIKDEKYNREGLYYFDPTFDCKQSEEDIDFLSSYKYFAMTRYQMLLNDKGHYKQLGYKELTQRGIDEFIKLVKEEKYDKIPNDVFKSLNHLSIFMSGKELICPIYRIPDFQGKPSKEEVLNKLSDIINKITSEISADVLINVLLNVRKQEYIKNPDKYKVSLDDFYDIYINSGWKFVGQESLVDLLSIFSDLGSSDNQKKEILHDYYMKYMKKHGITAEINKVVTSRKVVSNKNKKGETNKN